MVVVVKSPLNERSSVSPLSLGLLDKRVWVKGLLVECPLGCPLETCPANGVRSLPLPQLLEVAHSMSEELLDSIIKCHLDCQHRRVQSARRKLRRDHYA